MIYDGSENQTMREIETMHLKFKRIAAKCRSKNSAKHES